MFLAESRERTLTLLGFLKQQLEKNCAKVADSTICHEPAADPEGS